VAPLASDRESKTFVRAVREPMNVETTNLFIDLGYLLVVWEHPRQGAQRFYLARPQA
jgi:hypothetical protein